MVSPERRVSFSHRASGGGGGGGGGDELLHSLNKLSIATSSPAGGSTRSPRSIPSKTPTDHLPSNSPGTRMPAGPRSPSNLANPGGSRSGTPTLVRKTSTNSLRSNRAPSRKTSATNLRSPNTTNGNSPVMPAERTIPTETSVAREYFKKELEVLHAEPSARLTDTVIILHDACYGHRFSRPRASKSTLSTIVERPERIQASILGVSAAYVRLGERHCEGKVPIHPKLDPNSVPSIPFRILKTERTLPLDSPTVTNVHGTKWMEELKTMCESAETKLAGSGSELRRPDMHRGGDSEPPQKLHEGDLYLCPESQNAFEGALGAVCEAVDTVFSDSSPKRAFVAVRPPGHHCSASHPSGFCWVNNVQVGIMHGVLTHGLTHAAIIDFDLHHGDGSQGITWAHNKRGLVKNAAAWKKTSIGYFSLHDINSYPCEWGDEEKVKNASLCIDNAHGQNIWNVHLQEWKTEIEFWKLYQSKYSVLLEKARNFLRLQTERIRASGQVPKAAIFLSAGFDASEWEGVGMQRHKVNVPTEFYARITRDVVKIAGEEGLGVDGRVVSVLEGGYSDRALYSGVLSHLGGLAGNEPVFHREDINGGLGQEMSNKNGSFSRRNTLSSDTDLWLKNPGFPYDPSWWSVSELDKLDGYTAPTPQKLPKLREGPAPTYSSPTQASEAKLTEIAKIRRSLSGSSGPTGGHVYVSRAPTPPPPEVPWTAAAHELSRLLIPSNRQVNSYRHEELNPEAAKPKRERQSLGGGRPESRASTAGPPTRPSTRMSLRERKPTNYADPDSDIDRARRKTVGGALATEKAAARGKPTSSETKHLRRPSRRLSTVSNMSVSTHTAVDSNETDLRPGPDIVRPATSASFRTARPQTASGPTARRPRPAGAAQKDGARAPRTVKSKATAPVNTEPAVSQTAAANTTTPLDTTNTVKSVEETTTGHTSETATKSSPDASGGLDNITSGMKRIKINVLTKEKKEARQREAAEKAAAEQMAAEKIVPASNHSTEKTRSPTRGVDAPKAERPLSPPDMPRHGSGSPETGTPSIRSQPSPIPTIYEAPVETQEVELTESAIPSIVTTPTIETHPPPAFTQSSSPPAASTPTPTTPDLFVPYQPEGPTPESIPITGPVRILDPNTGTPAPNNRSPKKTQQFPPFDARALGLSPDKKGHGFTATSPIPFATPRPATSAGDGQTASDPTKEKPKRVWEVKETPQLRRQL